SARIGGDDAQLAVAPVVAGRRDGRRPLGVGPLLVGQATVLMQQDRQPENGCRNEQNEHDATQDPRPPPPASRTRHRTIIGNPSRESSGPMGPPSYPVDAHGGKRMLSRRDS